MPSARTLRWDYHPNRGGLSLQRMSSAWLNARHNKMDDFKLNNTRFGTKKARIDSFNGWSKEKPAPEDMAEAGFFYEGKSDRATCFNCNGTLKNWKEDDNPWYYHAKYFSPCKFVRMRKGKKYVEKIGRKNRITTLDASIRVRRVGGHYNWNGSERLKLKI
ncbi:Hypothetical predicted protein [Cloeon dipterum]|uniref:Inhibitor of apoptosis repeat-containing protein n=1 Tax=Cloeon dipterum TaxID=197152 RepID=A0A8S1CEY4_9INSE|nr:Hypothetical predicted protein [Cloeon dipterum]